jgi:2-dehydropantoate 2-reductase
MHQIVPESLIRDVGKGLRICVAGAGAIGITLATRMSISGYSVSVLARGESLVAIRKNGLSLTDAEGVHRADVTVGTADELANPDVLFLCTKAQDLESVAETVQPLIHSDTLIVPFINGIPWWYFEGVGGRHAGRPVLAVDPRQRLKQLLPGQRVIGAVTTITAERVAPGVARTRNPLRCVIGEIDHRRSDRTDRLAALLADSGIDTGVTQRIRDALWTKVIANLCSNPVSVVTGATLRDVCGDPSLSVVSRQLIDEGLLVAASFGARLELDPSSLLAMGASMGDFKTSMLQDYEKGLPLELAAICNAVMELGELEGLSMPFTRTITILSQFKSNMRQRAPYVALDGTNAA